MDWNSFVDILFPIGAFISIGIAYFANKYNWKIVKWF